jgi:hypothetical protein
LATIQPVIGRHCKRTKDKIRRRKQSLNRIRYKEKDKEMTGDKITEARNKAKSLDKQELINTVSN